MATDDQAVGTACQRAGVPHGFPVKSVTRSQLKCAKRFGLEGVQVLLGHAHMNISEVYAEKNAAPCFASRGGNRLTDPCLTSHNGRNPLRAGPFCAPT